MTYFWDGTFYKNPFNDRSKDFNGPFTVPLKSSAEINTEMDLQLSTFLYLENLCPDVAVKRAVNTARRAEYQLKKNAERYKRQKKREARLRALEQVACSEGVAVSEPEPPLKKTRS